MTYLDAGLPWWAVLAIVMSPVVVTVSGSRVQARHPSAPAATLAAIGGLLVGLVALAKWSGPGSGAETAVVSIVGWGLPAIASLAALALFRRAAPGARVTIALLAGIVGGVFGVLAALVAACGLFGSCL
jgi:hypothetical protein